MNAQDACSKRTIASVMKSAGSDCNRCTMPARVCPSSRKTFCMSLPFFQTRRRTKSSFAVHPTHATQKNHEHAIRSISPIPVVSQDETSIAGFPSNSTSRCYSHVAIFGLPSPSSQKQETCGGTPDSLPAIQTRQHMKRCTTTTVAGVKRKVPEGEVPQMRIPSHIDCM